MDPLLIEAAKRYPDPLLSHDPSRYAFVAGAEWARAQDSSTAGVVTAISGEFDFFRDMGGVRLSKCPHGYVMLDGTHPTHVCEGSK